MDIVWTRAADQWPKDSELLKGLEVLRLPCIQTEMYQDSEVNAQLRAIQQTSDFSSSASSSLSADIGIVTSALAARLVVQNKALLRLSKTCNSFYAVGPQSAEPLIKAGIRVEVPVGVSSARTLSSFLQTKACSDRQSVFFPGAERRAYDFAKGLPLSHFRLIEIDLYRTYSGLFTIEGGVDSRSASHLIRLIGSAPICFASPSAVQGFCSRFLKDGDYLSLKSLRACAIGPSTESEAGNFFAKLSVCPVPNLPELIRIATVE